MNRREWIVKTTKASLMILAAPVLVRCGNETDTAGLTVTSSNNGHTHTFTITQAELNSPESISRADSLSGGHTHTVALTQSQVSNIAAGGTVTVTSGSGGGHTHTYEFSLS